MGYPTKVQLIKRKRGVDQWYINFPTPLAQAMNFSKGEVVEWTIADKSHLVLSRRSTPEGSVKIKKKRKVSSNTSTGSGKKQGKASNRKRST